MAVRLLEEVCESKDILQLVVEMRPTLDHLDEVGDTLLLKYASLFSLVYLGSDSVKRFISTDVGFRFLFEAGYIDRQMDSWFNVRSMAPLLGAVLIIIRRSAICSTLCKSRFTWRKSSLKGRAKVMMIMI